MSFSLYDAVVPENLQVQSMLSRVLASAKASCEGRGMTQEHRTDDRLAPDMLPLGYQLVSCAVHSTAESKERAPVASQAT